MGEGGAPFLFLWEAWQGLLPLGAEWPLPVPALAFPSCHLCRELGEGPSAIPLVGGVWEQMGGGTALPAREAVPHSWFQGPFQRALGTSQPSSPWQKRQVQDPVQPETLLLGLSQAQEEEILEGRVLKRLACFVLVPG